MKISLHFSHFGQYFLLHRRTFFPIFLSVLHTLCPTLSSSYPPSHPSFNSSFPLYHLPYSVSLSPLPSFHPSFFNPYHPPSLPSTLFFTLLSSHPALLPDSIPSIRLDREIDPLSPLVTPLTYEGLISELMQTDYGKLRINPEKDSKVVVEGGGPGVPAQTSSGIFLNLFLNL